MYVYCKRCLRHYDDAVSWTLCPHGPLWAGVSAYCQEHDLVNCPFHIPIAPPPPTFIRGLKSWALRFFGARDETSES